MLHAALVSNERSQETNEAAEFSEVNYVKLYVQRLLEARVRVKGDLGRSSAVRSMMEGRVLDLLRFGQVFSHAPSVISFVDTSSRRWPC